MICCEALRKATVYESKGPTFITHYDDKYYFFDDFHGEVGEPLIYCPWCGKKLLH